MRYGLIRSIEGHLPITVQRSLIEEAGCDVILDEGPPNHASLKAQGQMLRRLKRGDELLVLSLDTLQVSTGEIALMLHNFDQAGVTLRIVGDNLVFTPPFGKETRRLLGLLAAHEKLRPIQLRRTRARSRPQGKPLSNFQLDYARDLIRHGAALRTIGMLFHVSPGELERLLASTDAEPKTSPARVALPRRRARS